MGYRKQARWIAGAAGVALSSAAQAQDAQADIVVTGSAVPVSIAEIGNAISVVTARDLEVRGTAYLIDALREVPGVAVGTSGSYGALSQVRLRGGDANHVLVMVDGVEVAPSGQGEFDFGTLLAGQVERVEVLRGPQSGLYGSNAMGGVINILTRGSGSDGTGITASAESGSHGTVALGGSGTVGEAGNFLTLSGAFRRSDGFSSAAIGTEADGNRNLTLYARGGAELAEGVRLGASLRRVDARAQTDGFDFSGGPLQGLAVDDDSYSDTRAWSGGVSLALDPLAGWENLLTASYAHDVLEGGYGDTGAFGSRGGRWKVAARTSLVESDGPLTHRMTLFADRERETYRNTFPYDPSQEPRQARAMTGVGGEYRVSHADRVFVRGAVRRDFNADFADVTTFSIAGAAIPAAGTRLHASFGTGVTNPTFTEQFGFVPGQFTGNPDLVPEKLRGVDFGVTQQVGRATLDVTWFRNRLTNEIYDLFPSVANRDGVSKAQGVELGGQVDLGPVQLAASYTWLDATDAEGVRETRRPRHSGSLTATADLGQGTLHAGLLYTGASEDVDYRDFFATFVPGRVTLDERLVARLAGSWELGERLELTGRVENAFDADYQESFSYAAPGLSAFAGIRLALP